MQEKANWKKTNVVILPKTQDQRLLAQYYSMADAFVICSKRENFPTTCVEAQCCGTPVVGFDTGGTKETSLYGISDFVEYGNLKGLSQKVRDASCRDVHNLALLANEEYSKDKMAKRYIEEYDRDGKKNKIMLIDVNCKGSSTGKIVYDLYEHIKKSGRKALVCYGRGQNITEESIYKFGLDWETNIHAALSRLTGYNGCFSPISTYRLIRQIKDFKPDIIHIHELHAYFVNIKPLLEYIKDNNIPLIWTFHCEYMYTGKCGHAYECRNFQYGCGDCPAIRDYPKSLFFDRTKQLFKLKQKLLLDMKFTIVTPSKWLRDRIKMSFLKNKDIKVIHNGIDTSIFHPVDSIDLKKKLCIPDGKKIILALAPNIMSEYKGGKWVVELAGMMKNEYYFVIVGE